MTRTLTNEEIEDILRDVPTATNPDPRIEDVVRRQALATLRISLEKVRIVPVEIPNLKLEIIRTMQAAFVRPGSTVGDLAADAVTAPTSQSGLNLQRTAGSRATTMSAIDGVKEIIYATEKRRNPTTQIYFSRSLNFNEILDIERPRLEEVLVSDLLVPDSTEVDAPRDLLGDQEPWWYENFRMLTGRNFASGCMVRLHLDPVMLARHRITPEDVTAAFDRQPQPIVIVPSPAVMVREEAMVGGRTVDVDAVHFYLDVYPDEGEIKAADSAAGQANRSLVFIHEAFLPSLAKVQVKGVHKIRNLVPTKVVVMFVVKAEVPKGDGVWTLYMDEKKMRSSGIRREHLVDLVRFVGMEVLEGGTPTSLEVRIPENIRERYQRPSQVVGRYVDEEKAADVAYRRAARERFQELAETDPSAAQKVRFSRPTSEFSRIANLYNVVAEGNNLAALLIRDDIDPYRTMSNNFHETLAAFGIEAARNLLMQELRLFIESSGAKTSMRHVSLIVDFMTRSGTITKITYSGMKRTKMGPFTLATFEQPAKALAVSASVGGYEPISGVATSVLVGKKPPIGPSFEEPPIDPGLRRRLETEAAKALAGKMPIRLDPVEFNLGMAESQAELLGINPISSEERGIREFHPTREAFPINISKTGYIDRKPEIIPAYQTSRVLDMATSGIEIPCAEEEGEEEYRIEPMERQETAPLSTRTFVEPPSETSEIYIDPEDFDDEDVDDIVEGITRAAGGDLPPRPKEGLIDVEEFLAED